MVHLEEEAGEAVHVLHFKWAKTVTTPTSPTPTTRHVFRVQDVLCTPQTLVVDEMEPPSENRSSSAAPSSKRSLTSDFFLGGGWEVTPSVGAWDVEVEHYRHLLSGAHNTVGYTCGYVVNGSSAITAS